MRIAILNLLQTNTLSLLEIADTLNIPISSTAAHIKRLEEAHLIVTETRPGVHGSMRVCICSVQSILFETAAASFSSNMISIEMPIGAYYDCEIVPTCGLAGETGPIGIYDKPSFFFSNERINAKLLWFQQGFVEYRFQNAVQKEVPVREISFSMELCSEAPGYMEQWLSDITISCNDKELTTYCSIGDFGARRGRLTPSYWPNGQTQYGLLKVFSVTNNGVYVDKKLVNPNLTLADLELEKKPYISLKIEIKEDAQHIGGINLFGDKFGDYPQGIIMNLVH